MSKEKDLEISRELVKLLDDLLATGDWDASLFLRNSKKKFLKLRSEAESIVEELGGPAVELQQHEIPVPEGYIKVYISLYQTDGNSLQIWQNMLKSLAQYSVSRPVYADEEWIQELIRSKPVPQRHAYAVVAVKEADVLHNGKSLRDSFGHDLVLLREKAAQPKNVLEFVHANKRRYGYRDGILTPFD